MTDDLTERLAGVQRAMAAPLPSPAELAAWKAEDRALAERIHRDRPGVPLHHAYAVLETLRVVQRIDAAKEAPEGAVGEPATDEPDPFAAAHAERGFTIGAYFPQSVPWEIVDGTFDLLADHVHAFTDGRWDVSVIGGAGDQLGVSGQAELTRDELRGLVDEQGLDLYRAQDRLAYIAEMCDLVDRNGQAVTTARVRMWLEYNGRAGALVLPEAPASVAAPATGEEQR
ncbi:hypothetical protein [Streptacidiphilus sp. EB129]|uniref:hypothetical protein n=1 Tax=Streptacidiphilus sp. EB129 TaxID=3156262 RepID=UPI0035195298